MNQSWGGSFIPACDVLWEQFAFLLPVCDVRTLPKHDDGWVDARKFHLLPGYGRISHVSRHCLVPSKRLTPPQKGYDNTAPEIQPNVGSYVALLAYHSPFTYLLHTSTFIY